jgi:hypothetical protein
MVLVSRGAAGQAPPVLPNLDRRDRIDIVKLTPSAPKKRIWFARVAFSPNWLRARSMMYNQTMLNHI